MGIEEKPKPETPPAAGRDGGRAPGLRRTGLSEGRARDGQGKEGGQGDDPDQDDRQRHRLHRRAARDRARARAATPSTDRGAEDTPP